MKNIKQNIIPELVSGSSTQVVAVNNIRSHSRGFLSGIFHACSYNNRNNTLINRYKEDPGQQPSGMTALCNTPSPQCLRTRPSPSRERGGKKACVRSIHLRARGPKSVLTLHPFRERGNNKLSPSPVGEKVGVAGMRGKGFTLIELLVVVLIIGILAAVALPQYQVAVKKATLAQYMELALSIKNAEQIYYMENGAYTFELQNLILQVPVGENCNYVRTSTQAYYDCGNVRYGVFGNLSNVQAGDDTIRYIHYWEDFQNDAGIEFQKGDIVCYSRGEIARQACRSLGVGEEYDNSAVGWDYAYILARL